jgi:hypothetical protein
MAGRMTGLSQFLSADVRTKINEKIFNIPSLRFVPLNDRAFFFLTMTNRANV